MRYFRPLLFINCILIIFILTSCFNKNVSEECPKVRNISVSSTINSEILQKSEVLNTLHPTNFKSDAPKPTPTTSKNIAGVVLSTATMNDSNKHKYSWWLKYNKNNNPPWIPTDIQELIAKNGALYLGPRGSKKVYLTFDEGYEFGFTTSILDTLKTNNIKSIFFITGSYLKNNEPLVKRMIEEGHQIGNHTMTHPSLSKISDQQIENEIIPLDNELMQKFHIKAKYLRPPNGDYSEHMLEVVKNLGLTTVFWSFAYDDYNVKNQRGADYAYEKVISNLHDGVNYFASCSIKR